MGPTTYLGMGYQKWHPQPYVKLINIPLALESVLYKEHLELLTHNGGDASTYTGSSLLRSELLEKWWKWKNRYKGDSINSLEVQRPPSLSICIMIATCKYCHIYKLYDQNISRCNCFHIILDWRTHQRWIHMIKHKILHNSAAVLSASLQFSCWIHLLWLDAHCSNLIFSFDQTRT